MSNKIQVGGIFERTSLCMMDIIGLPHQPGTAAKVFDIFSSKQMPLEFISQSQTSSGKGTITLCLSAHFCEQMEDVEKIVQKKLNPQAIHRKPSVFMLTVYGPHFAEKPTIASALCATLGRSKVNIIGISTSINSITVVLGAEDIKNARLAVDEIFQLPEY